MAKPNVNGPLTPIFDQDGEIIAFRDEDTSTIFSVEEVEKEIEAERARQEEGRKDKKTT